MHVEIRVSFKIPENPHTHLTHEDEMEGGGRLSEGTESISKYLNELPAF